MSNKTDYEKILDVVHLAQFFNRPELADQLRAFAYETKYEVVETLDDLSESNSSSDLLRAAGFGGGAGLETIRIEPTGCPHDRCANDCDDYAPKALRNADCW